MRPRLRRIALAISAAFAGTAAPGQTPLTPQHDNGLLVFRSLGGAFEYFLDGRLHIDAATYRNAKNQLANGLDVRRVRLGGKATLFTSWRAEFDLDFAERSVEIKDAWLGYRGFAGALIKFGQFKEPFSFETLTSSKDLILMERAYIDALAPDRNMGISYTRFGLRYHASAGLFAEGADSKDTTGRSEGFGVTARYAFVPFMQSGHVLHLGVAASTRTPDAATGEDTNTVAFASRAETSVSRAQFLSTGPIRGASRTNRLNAEVAYVRGPLTLLGEYTRAWVPLVEGGDPDPNFDGYYLTAAWFLTGESRRYSLADGNFDRVLPYAPFGALEIAARVSSIDLNEAQAGILGGRATNYTIGFNWHANANFRLMFNYVRVLNDGYAVPDLTPRTPIGGDNFHILQFRFGVGF
jgi:phosphate-selective porin OprO/OprP